MTNSNENFLQSGRSFVNRALDTLQFAAPLATRLMVGITFFYTGHGKLQNLDRTGAFFGDLGIPFPAANAVFISCLEFFGGICLMLGLGTRVFAALLSSTMVVALLTADKENLIAKFPAELTDVSPVVLLLLLGWLVFFGAGALSIDRLAGRFVKKLKNQELTAVQQKPVNDSAA